MKKKTRWTRGRMLAATVSTAALGIAALVGAGGASAVPGPTDLAIDKRDNFDPIRVGDLQTYLLEIRNIGTNDATDVIVTDTLPREVTFVSANTSAGSCTFASQVVTCPLGTVNAGATVTAAVVVKPRQAGTISNTASLTTTVTDANAANNQDTEQTLVVAPRVRRSAKAASCSRPTILGTEGDDVIIGTNRNDVIVGLAGNDEIIAGRGSDLICAGAGFDIVAGKSGADVISGGADSDLLRGNGGPDEVRGNSGRDRLRGGNGNDFLNGGKSRDSCVGGRGADRTRRCP